jgi:hypothetical protein
VREGGGRGCFIGIDDGGILFLDCLYFYRHMLSRIYNILKPPFPPR